MFDSAIILEIAGMMVGIDAEQFITRTVYSVIASDEDIAALEQKSVNRSNKSSCSLRY